jgi:hypothetical protein
MGTDKVSSRNFLPNHNYQIIPVRIFGLITVNLIRKVVLDHYPKPY